MISYDFPRILGKSGVYLIQPPKICAGQLRVSDVHDFTWSRESALLGRQVERRLAARQRQVDLWAKRVEGTDIFGTCDRCVEGF